LVGLLQFQKPSHGTVAHLGDGSLSTGHIAACEQQNLRFIIHNNLASYSGFDPPSTLPRSASSIFLREVVDPAITQNLTVSCTQITNLFCDGVAFSYPYALRDAIIDSNLK
jgi:hypothetical protein